VKLSDRRKRKRRRWQRKRLRGNKRGG